MNYISSKIILEKISKFHIPGTDWNDEEIYEWIYEALEMIDNNHNVIIDEAILYLEDGKVKMPVQVQNIKQIITYTRPDSADIETRLEESHDGYTLKYDYNYLLNNGYLYSNIQEPIKVMYSTIPLDKDDYPMIPDNSYFLKALEAYCRFKIGERAYFAGKLMNPQYQTLQQDWLWRLPGATTAGKMDIMDDKYKFAKMHKIHKI